jgi:hypothetical protein
MVVTARKQVYLIMGALLKYSKYRTLLIIIFSALVKITQVLAL